MNPDKLSEYPASGSTSTFLSMLLQETRLVASKVCVWVGVGVSLVGVSCETRSKKHQAIASLKDSVASPLRLPDPTAVPLSAGTDTQ